MNRVSQNKNGEGRRAVATVEAAVCLPVLILLVFGAIESSNGIFLKQSMTMAAYEAAKVAASPRGTKALATQRCKDVLAVRDISNFEISFVPNTLSETTASGTKISVTITVDADAAALGPLWIFEGKKLTKTVQMQRL